MRKCHARPRNRDVLKWGIRKASKFYTQFKQVIPPEWKQKLKALARQNLVQRAIRKGSRFTKNLESFVGMIQFPDKKDMSRLMRRWSRLEKRLQSMIQRPSR